MTVAVVVAVVAADSVVVVVAETAAAVAASVVVAVVVTVVAAVVAQGIGVASVTSRGRRNVLIRCDTRGIRYSERTGFGWCGDNAGP